MRIAQMWMSAGWGWPPVTNMPLAETLLTPTSVTVTADILATASLTAIKRVTMSAPMALAVGLHFSPVCVISDGLLTAQL